jgi:Uma2 family endonuclease
MNIQVSAERSLYNGDHLKQPEFHKRYRLCPEDMKFELIGGIVYMPSPMRWRHATYHLKLGLALETYASGTPGVEVGDSATTILDDKSEPQPDLALRVLSEYGGRSWLDEEEYVNGPPELVAEIAHSTVSIDLHRKREDYQRAGVLEYLVLCVEEQELHWFHFKSQRRITADKQGVFRSRVFPGLWIDGPALLARRSARIAEVVQEGLASSEHAAFVKKLEAAHRKGNRNGGRRRQ